MGRRKRNKGSSRPRFRVTSSPRDRAGDHPSQASSPRGDGAPPAPSPTPSIGEAAWFAPALTAAYALVLAFALFHHELWRDELQAWMFARDSTGPLDLFRNMEYEASPMLWHLLLMPVTRLTSSPVGMQILHWAIASAAIFVVARYAPFGPLQKVLFAFGYFPLYEYGVMSRNYALGLLCIVVACALLRQRYRRPLWLALVLVLMSHTSAHACIVAIAMLLALALDYGLDRRALAEDGAVDVRKLRAGFAVAAAGILLSVLQMMPPADVTQSAGMATWRHSWFLELKWPWLEAVLKLIPGVVFLPADPRFVPVVALHPGQPEAVYGVWMAAALVAAVAAFHRRRPIALFLFLCLVAGLLFFFYAGHLGSIRHHGFLLISLLVTVWGGRFLTAGPHTLPGSGARAPASVAEGRGDPRAGPAAAGEVRGRLDGRRIGGIVLTGFLAMHAFGGLRAVATEVERPFSLAERTAGYIRDNGLESLPMLGFPDWSASAVLGHLSPQKRIHYLQGDREGSFVIYDGARIGTGPRGSIRISTMLAQLQALAARNDGKVLMIFAGELEFPPGERRFRPLASFTGAIADDEDFYLYLYETPADGDRAPG